MSSNSYNKLFVFGLDGGTFDIILPLIEQGKLPNFKKILDSGCHSILKSTVPPVTAPAWISFMTGNSSFKTGVFEFRKLNLSDYSNYTTKLMDLSCVESKTFIEILSENGKKVLSLFLPMTYPPFKTNGIMLSGFPRPENNKLPVYPHGYYDKIKHLKPEKLIIKPTTRKKRFAKNLDIRAKKEAELALEIIDSESYDCCIFVMSTIDHGSHFFWDRCLDDTDNTLRKQYIYADRVLGEILNRLNEKTALMIMSDHGFGPTPGYFFYINKFLIDTGYLCLKRDLDAATVPILNRAVTKIKQSINPVLWQKLKDFVPKNVKNGLWQAHKNLNIYDFENTKLFGGTLYLNYAYFNVNLKNRQEYGIVEKSKYNSMLDLFLDKLSLVKTPANKKIINDVVYRKKDHKDTELPDLILEFNEDIEIRDTLKNNLFEKRDKKFYKFPGQHRKNGIFMMKGPGTKKIEIKDSPYIYDLMPTILYYLGSPIPKDIEGKVIEEIFDNSFLNKHKIKYLEDNNNTHKYDRGKEDIKESEKTMIEEQLKNMGYLD